MAALHTMEVLTRPAGAPRSSPSVISDSSMTMSFSLPASFLQARAALSTAAVAGPKRAGNGVEEVGDSWEERDWESEALQTVKAKPEQQESDDWEQETTPDLPDDFPRLIVNLTRVQRHHFPVSKEDEQELDMMEVFRRVKATLHQHFSQLAEVLFEQTYPDDLFAMVDYPTEIDDVPLHEFLHTLSYPSKWKSVEYLKDCLRRCSRDIRWKRDVIAELEVLAEQEFAQYEEKQQRLSDEIDELTRLRDSFREKLEKMTSHDGKPNGQYLILRKLEDIENRLVTLLDDYLKEPELEEEECYSAFGNPGGEGGVRTGMNVLDMVIAMVFGRLPRDFTQQTSTEEHFQMLFDHHIHILRLWKKDFGRLPPQSRAAPPKPDGADSDELSEREQAVDDISGHDDIDEQGETISSYGRVDDGDAESLEEASLDGLDGDWERVHFEDTTLQGNDSDGYGADFDSDESEDDEEQTAAVRVQMHEKLEQGDAGKSSVSTRPGRRRVKRSTRRSKKLLQSTSERHYNSDEERKIAPFQPFACTGAVGLLRLAKENEMF
ncbi:uncharacterized protein PITG_02885 [Phytophthora infestans T30-4]|uniref:Uncharacterized protein n=1 Tax=Phytophthora infestans (strain T30-4) TaxID=403677 RepID=D0MXF3_PHYIT|nr:uncharacterized protein PITG_02885 [Phytophthora infestans T30-4]EEY64316.1 conserved hypothetical protein [Phytophthora infestans T30-4]|eukprot:XP_002907752.1 conserved hypothetical protein [Phytophthora infestans T30-4]